MVDAGSHRDDWVVLAGENVREVHFGGWIGEPVVLSRRGVLGMKIHF